MTDSQPHILETERLILRKLTIEDLDALAALYRDPEVRQYFPERTLTYEETREELEWIIDVYYGQHGFGLWATIHKPTGAFIGRCGLLPWEIEGVKEVEVAYLLDRAYWGQGLATEVARAIVRYGFEQLQFSRLICLVDPQNRASRSVAEKIGMMFEREGDIEEYPVVFYGMSKPEGSP
jgi:[ribosomal protein S5]-alanine N-acetyltransferase